MTMDTTEVDAATGETVTRPMTPTEQAAWDAASAAAQAENTARLAREANMATLTAQAIAAFNLNRAAITRNAASVAVANPTNAQVVAGLKDALNQLSQLEQQNNAIMRLLLGILDGTN